MNFKEWLFDTEVIELNEGWELRYTHRVLPDFLDIWNSGDIPENVKKVAQKSFSRMVTDPSAVDLKHMVSSSDSQVYSAKISDKWRALAVKKGTTLYWFWIGPRETINNFRHSSLKNPNLNLNQVKPRRNPEAEQKPLKLI